MYRVEVDFMASEDEDKVFFGLNLSVSRVAKLKEESRSESWNCGGLNSQDHSVVDIVGAHGTSAAVNQVTLNVNSGDGEYHSERGAGTFPC